MDPVLGTFLLWPVTLGFNGLTTVTVHWQGTACYLRYVGNERVW